MSASNMSEHFFNNPIKILNHLKAAGFTQKQAEAQVEIISDYIEHGIVTRKDLKRDLKELELRMTIKTAAIVGSIVGFFSILEKIL